MTVKKETAIIRYIGTHSDTKPTGTTVPIGSTYYEWDTDDLYITYDNTNWVERRPSEGKTLKRIKVTKALMATASYIAEDVLSEINSSVSATAWVFQAIASHNGGSGKIIQAQVESQTNNVTPILTMYLFSQSPNCELSDNVANEAPRQEDVSAGVYLGRIDFPALEDLGASANSNAQVTDCGTSSTLPVYFNCASGADDIYGVLVTRSAFTQTASHDMAITLIAEAY